MNSIVICDTETTGLHPDRHRIIEVALSRIDDNNWQDFKVETWRFDLSPQDYSMGEPMAYQVNGYYPGHPDWVGAPINGSPEASAAFAQIAARLHKASLVNQNVSFDAKFLWEELCRHNVQRVGGSTTYASDPDIAGAPWEGSTWDVGAFCRVLMKAAGRKGWKLHTAYAEVCKGPELPPHRAEADVLRALWVLAEGTVRHPNVWPDFKVPADDIKAAVEKWAKEHRA